MPIQDVVQEINLTGVRSLAWAGDALVDWVGGQKRIHPNGQIEESRVIYAYRFDAVSASSCGEFAVIHERLGTKGIIVESNRVYREINRSYYFATHFEYPVALFRTETGQLMLIHCPESYCQLEIEDFGTGERVACADFRKGKDFFHSRLRVSPDGRWLLSAGWFWQPWDYLALFDLKAALENPKVLDASMALPVIEGAVSSAEFLPDSRVLVSTSSALLNESDADPNAVGANALAVFDPATGAVTSCVNVSEPVGSMMVVDQDHVVGFHTHPKLISLSTGRILKRWDAIRSGMQTSSILIGLPDGSIPPIAMDRANQRFAVASEDSISVVTLTSRGASSSEMPAGGDR